MRLQKAKQETQTKPRFQRAPPSQKKGAEAPPAPPPPHCRPFIHTGLRGTGRGGGQSSKAEGRRGQLAVGLAEAREVRHPSTNLRDSSVSCPH